MMKTKTLTEGTPWKQILLFSIPIFWGNVFQLLYSLVDTKIVGSTLGTEALAAVGSVSTLHTLMTGFLNGLTLGFSLITAMCFGAKNRKRLKKTFAAAISLGVLTTLALVLMLMIFLHPVLNLLHVPQAQFEMAYAYISVLIVGLLCHAVLQPVCQYTAGYRGCTDTVDFSDCSNCEQHWAGLFVYPWISDGSAGSSLCYGAGTAFVCGAVPDSYFPEIPDSAYTERGFPI